MGRYFLSGLAIVSLTILEWQAIKMGIDGALFASVIAIIAGLAGYRIAKK